IAQLCRRSRIAIAAKALAIFGLMGNHVVAHLLMRPLAIRHIPSAPLPQADAIVVLGGVTAPATAPQPTVRLGDGADRLTYGAELYRSQKAPLVVLGGGVMPWNEGAALESAQMAEVMQMRGVPRPAIIEAARDQTLTDFS